MIFKEYNQTDIINIKNQIDRLRACGIGVADLPQNLRDSVWKIVYCELKQNGSRQNTVSKAADGVCQSNILKKMFGLPKDVFGKKYWNMYSPDSKIRQEKYSDLQLPFNYAQVECNSVYRAMIHHMITGADVPTDTVVDIFGKFGLAAALCAGGYKYKIVCLNEQNYYLYSLLQDVMRKPVKFYKMIDEERKYLEIKFADNEIKDIMKSQIQHLGQIKVLVYYGVRKNVGGQYSYESTGYTKEQIAKYIFICLLTLGSISVGASCMRSFIWAGVSSWRAGLPLPPMHPPTQAIPSIKLFGSTPFDALRRAVLHLSIPSHTIGLNSKSSSLSSFSICATAPATPPLLANILP